MMVETTNPTNTSSHINEMAAQPATKNYETEPVETTNNNNNDDNHSRNEPAEEPAPTPSPVLPRKTWVLPKAPPPNSIGPKKKTLVEIMEEEKRLEQESQMAKQKALEERLAQEEEAALIQAMQASMAAATTSAATQNNNNATNKNDDDDMDEDLKLALMLSMQDEKLPPSSSAASAAAIAPAVAAAIADNSNNDTGLTEEEMREIEKALQEADAAEKAKSAAASLKLALELQNEEDGKIKSQKRGPQEGNVRTMNRADFLREQGKAHDIILDGAYHDDDDDGEYDFDDMDNNGTTEAGFRINSTKPSPWSRADRATIRGPNQELRTKHDLKLQAQANAYRLEVRADDETGERAHVGNKAYNAFHRSMQKKTVKGVAAHGHGRATADADKTREGALDGRVRLQIARAVNNGLIETFNGCVKEGKEAMVFHAGQGSESEGFDVAVKVFKRIQEFKNRVDYVEGDPRYMDGNFRHAGPRQQVEQWAEKEHRNLVRAYRSKVPCARPLWQKENVLFMRFLGEDGWPSPQLRELDIKRGSKKWTALYEQTMLAMQRLYCEARLIHGDLSEYNILVCPARFLERVDEAANTDVEEGDLKLPAGNESEVKPAADSNLDDDIKIPAKPETFSSQEPTPIATTATPNEAPPGDGDELQIVLIDFGQAVDLRHPEAEELLRRDVLRVKQFYDKMGITTIGVEAAMAYVQTKDALLR